MSLFLLVNMNPSPQQMRILEALFAAGFRPLAIPPYENALCMRKGDCIVPLAPVPNGGLKLLAPASFLVNGNFSVLLKREAGDVFVWKKTEIPATPERLRELDTFRRELNEILGMPATQ